ncbi:uncharacterized protein LOC132735008 [Ruditapes philippinarum]|uniref:uncharacterized protein LOC132735008 n=1 Tax=Ruditapes philippinarum TaxID=129788 RepID=UPI00295B865C|nr:uncharacterized protein LOC132735008 [Ruditapes philippinarum]
MFYIALLWCIAFVTVTIGLADGSVSKSGLSFDLCNTKTLRLLNIDDSGIIKYDNSSSSSGQSSGLGCVLKIESCSSCQIQLKISTDDNFTFFCQTGIVHSKYCSLGCDYLSIFDMYYMNETLRYYRGVDQIPDVFHSESSNIFIMLCHGGMMKNYNFQISFSITQKMKTVHGSSDTSSATGLISSPFFPTGYAQNHEVYKYVISSTDADDYIIVTFDDWHLSETSSLYFVKSNQPGQFNGGSNRPVVLSDSSLLQFTFSTGVSLTAGENRDFIGFRAAYKFYKGRQFITKPNTNCKGLSYLMSSKGGRISFSPASPTRELYDCLWVVKTQEDFEGTYLKIIRLRINGHVFRGENQIVIRDGISSDGAVRAKHDMLDNINNGIPHYSKTGFYIRLNASLSSSDSVILTYASYKMSPGCGSDLFVCGNDKCIDKNLICDGYDHCGDNSDEVAGCADNTGQWDKSYQYTITIGVIVPMVISVFLIMVICLLFVMIRRCRRARLREALDSSERLQTVSEDVTERRRRRRHRRRLGLFGSFERDRPPTYDEAMQNPPGWYLNVAFGNPVDPSLPQPPSYHEAISADTSAPNTNPRQTPGSPTSTDSSQSELTVCSGHLSDSSSSSDEGSTWGTYNGDGDGRRGRLGRHVSSSESEPGTLDSRPRSAASPVQTEPRSDSVATSTENTQNRVAPVEELHTVESMPKDNKDNIQIARKEHEKKVNNAADDFVVPAGPKPGCSDPQINVCRPKTYAIGAPQGLESCAPVAPSNHHRNISSGSEAAIETGKKPKKKPRKSKSKKASNQPVHAPEILENAIPDLNFNEYLINQGHSNIPEIASTNQETSGAVPQASNLHDNSNFFYPTSNLTENSAESSPKVQASTDADLAYQVVVNVDNDDVLVVYDSADEKFGQNMSPAQVSKADKFKTNGRVDLTSENSSMAANAMEMDQTNKKPCTNTNDNLDLKYNDRERNHFAPDDTCHGAYASLGQKPSAVNDVDCDQTVMSFKQREDKSDNYTNSELQIENGATRVNEHMNQPSVSLRNDLDDTEDIYV